MRTEPTGYYRGPPTTPEQDAEQRRQQMLKNQALLHALRAPRVVPPEPKTPENFLDQDGR